VTQKEKLESECQGFQALAFGEGLSQAESLLPVHAQNFADKLMWAKSVQDCEKLIQSQGENASAFWHVMDIVLARVRGDRMHPGVPPIRAGGPLAVLACTVLDYYDKLDDRFYETF